MTEPARISEMVGIRSEVQQPDAVWPLNFVLLVLGAAILGVAFGFLDAADPRPLYNPWTYAIATPVALLALSALLSTVVSRVVEKSMQLAFLLSVLIHLILLVCAVNVVVFSRMWPDVLDSLEQQREELKREQLHARQYHRVGQSKQTGGRPDYLKPVATEHQPTEIEPSLAPMLALARSDRANLVSPSPKVELSHSPNLLEREQPAASVPSPSASAASLSRSDVAVPRADASAPRFEYQPPEANQPAPLAPSPLSVARKSAARASAPGSAPSLPVDLATRPAPTTELPARRSSTAALEYSPAPSSLARQNLALEETGPQPRGDIAAPPADSGSASVPAALSPADLAQRRRGERARADAGVSLQSPPVAPAVVPRMQSPPDAVDRRDWIQPGPSAISNSDTRLALPRSTAGGELGAGSPASLPVRGLEALGTSQPIADVQARMDSSVTDRRRSPVRSSASQLPTPAELGAETWNGIPSLSGGTVGLSPSQLARNLSQARGAAEDVARLAGAERDLDRSTLSRAGQSAPAAAQVEVFPSSSAEASGALDFTGDNPAPLAATGAGIARSPADARGLQGAPVSPTLRAALPDSRPLEQWTGNGERAVHPSALLSEAATATGDSPALPRSGALSAVAPGRSDINLSGLEPSLDPANEPTTSAATASGAGLSRRAESDADGSLATPVPANLLAVDAMAGPGGVASTSGLAGPLLGRSDSRVDRWSPPQLDPQRFARQDVGGPLAAGQQVALPKPAFQQRIDRLKDRQPQLESSLEPQTELAIERGLEFLAKHQRDDGSWRLQDFDTPVLIRSDTAATGLALLAFQGAGYTHNQFKYAGTVERALQYLVQHQSISGDLYVPQDPASDQNAWLYSHAIASLALCEAVGMTQDDQLRPAAQKAIDFMVASQDPRRGGWRYRPGVGADTSVTGWFMMAFKSGQLAGLQVPQSSMRGIEQFLVASQAADGQPHLYRYNPFAADTPQQRHGLQPTSVMTSVGLLMRLYFGWKRDRAEMLAGADYLLEHLPEHGSLTASRRDTYYWYYATQVMFHMRGEHWQRWHDRLYPLLINSQIAQGDWAGSWDPNYPTPDLWARYGGRLYVTTLNLLSLEVSYRHLPLYEATAQ